GLLWQQSPSTSGNPPKGPWYIPETSYFYIGIRKNGNNYGWIEVDASDPRDPKFLAVALKCNLTNQFLIRIYKFNEEATRSQITYGSSNADCHFISGQYLIIM